ncbi:FAD-binding oxidoreductase [Subtercola boreus]|uniref:FAD-binding oxidoreductase n=1 Tax=Subtercola boreus TaxID=120213 RepID=UPI001169CABB|nr:FAD-binding oxidoreductase [Subtercola boreus]TQL54449.1 glycolate oxidase [Subtercola boreus]
MSEVPGAVPVPGTGQALAAAVARLRADGVGVVLTGAETTLPYARDRSGHDPGDVVFAVVVARSVADVQQVCRVSAEFGVPVIPRGAGTGYAGGAAATEGAIILSLGKLTAITGIDPDSGLCVVEPGVITSEISAAARAVGLRYAPDPASAAISTIGGNIATNAGGLCCVKYGVTRDSVLALDVVLAGGELIHTGHRSIKGVSGYDLTALFVGSEGTLGVVVGATLRLLPVPLGSVHTIAAFFETAEQATAASVDLFATGVRPSMLELIDGVHLSRIDDWRGSDFRARGAGLLLVQTDGLAAAAEAALLRDVLVRSGGEIEVTDDARRTDELLDIRRWTSQDQAPRPEITLNEDFAVPRHRLVEMVRLIEATSARFGVVITILAHIGDGNLHANLRIPRSELGPDGALPERAWLAADAMIAGALEFGGTITGEHGIGMLKRRWLRTELGDVQYGLQRSLKTLFDPQHLLNPGKVFLD